MIESIVPERIFANKSNGKTAVIRGYRVGPLDYRYELRTDFMDKKGVRKETRREFLAGSQPNVLVECVQESVKRLGRRGFVEITTNEKIA